MIRVTRLDGSHIYINAELIQSVQSTPDTHIVLLNGYSYVVKERDEDIVDEVMRYRQRVAGGGRPPLELVRGAVGDE